MARESKHDRIVRTMSDQVMEHLHDLKKIEENSSSKESDVERWAQSFLKACLGFTSSSGYSIKSQETKGKARPDLIVLKDDKPVFVVEVKRSGYDLRKSDFRSGKTQLGEYLNTLGGVRWGILTNGAEWRIFDFSKTEYGGFEISAIDLKSESDQIELNKKYVEEICYELLDCHESAFASDGWATLSKEALAFSPESLSRAILSSDVVKYIARSIRGEHDYKANHEMLTDKLYWLLEQGLNDAIQGWNDTKAVELHKYIKSQKRTNRRSSRAKKESSKQVTNSDVNAQADTTEAENQTKTDAA